MQEKLENPEKRTILDSEENLKKRIQRLKNSLRENSDDLIEQYSEEYNYYEDYEEYNYYEEYIRNPENVIFTWKVAGPLHFAMSQDKMREKIIDVFKAMVESGHLMTKNDFEEQIDQETIFPMQTNDLTRIWGANYINEHKNKITAAKHYLVIDNDESFTVNVWLETNYYQPCLRSVKSGGYVVAEKIEGVRAASDYKFSEFLDAIKYRDFADPGNVIESDSRGPVIVDTEIKSFDIELKGYARQLSYLKDRFFALNPKAQLSIDFEIPLSAIFGVAVTD